MNRRERKKEETKSKLIREAMDLFKKKDFKNTTMEEIAEIADVSKGTLYNYFQDKESILSAYFQLLIQEKRLDIMEALEAQKTIEAKLDILLDINMKMLGDDLELLIIYFKHRLHTFFDNNPMDTPQHSVKEQLLLGIISKAQENKEIRDDIPAFVIAKTFQFLSLNYFITSVYDQHSGDNEILKKHLIEMFLKGTKV
ncbi:transcriptional regulator, TetR family [Alkaliphilus metalliredigens QYMF]|uniref:Transcriptional regulator, TetR family n=1 Tax=Alkaliphilus metalliredigens (strain QYMF) TaxID=293826 RepID=A6TPF9_ALKMQ|nr:TetR/AcrR family transcriptional regulator [Alkaliphilus metalliredigens]ABR48077.1 transcriptional regulator, TetR family [Alkaliphilus metalliredigens QYMF]